MSALGRVIRSGMARRRVQTLVIGLATMLAVTASVLGGALLVSSEAPFEKAFDRQNGAQLTAQFDARRATAAQLAAAARVLDATATSGPFPTATITPGIDGHSGAPLSVVGRATSGGEIDKMTMTRGRWVEKPGEVVVSADTGPEGRLGQKLEFPDLPGSPTLTVVGVARSVSRTADAWVLPSQIAELTPSGKVAGYQMLYRFAHADTAAQMTRDRAAVTAAVPAKSLTGAQSWLGVKKVATRETALFVPFLVAFGVLGLVMSVLIVGNVVAGAVATGQRRIGILKAVGCTPGQVVRACAGQALIPATVGAALGTTAGHLLAAPVLSETADAYGTAGLGVESWADVTVVGGVLGLVALTACASAWRAGRLRTVDALAVGRTPGAARWRWATAPTSATGRGRWTPRRILATAQGRWTTGRTSTAGQGRQTAGRTPAEGRGRWAAGRIWTTAEDRRTGEDTLATSQDPQAPGPTPAASRGRGASGRIWAAGRDRRRAGRAPTVGQDRQTAGRTPAEGRGRW
ncbi:ABC transporter permease, partial [Streptomyces sp. NPDC058469]|uniref:ABC transporter permease n=1 Tax=Streptomyces sp. NPDC058469 TaxID=3346514 RepID=UPI00364C21A2